MTTALPFRIGYNTNGFAHHRLEDAIEILADLGYESVAITLDFHALNPYEPGFAGQLRTIQQLLGKRRLRCVVETGARFLLDPRQKHQPTLLSSDETGRRRRLDFLLRALDVAVALEADCVSFWSGRTDGDAAGSEGRLFDRLLAGCETLCRSAERLGMRLAFEPEPGMFIDSMARFAELHHRLSHPCFGLTIDIGHLHCQGETPIEAHLERWQQLIWNIHIEDMRRGEHEHLMFGEGEIDFAPVLATLQDIGYSGGVHVELSRHSHDAIVTARRSLAFLRSHLSGRH
ncbi:MAG: xylose isomerase [Gemmatales bacterium]|nr:MAG: xylose isomerase [Gemmatales bacterium]